MATTCYALVEPHRGESPANPGGLWRRREENGGLWYEVYLGDDHWEDRSAVGFLLDWSPDTSAQRIDETTAQKVINNWPPANLREGFKR
jgi:hypothetical protein